VYDLKYILSQSLTEVKIEATYDFMEDKLFLQSKEKDEDIFVNFYIVILHYTRRKSDANRYTINVGEKYKKLEIDYRCIPNLRRIIEEQGGFNGEKLAEYINSNIEQFKKSIVGNVQFTTSDGYNIDQKYFTANQDKASITNEKWLASVSECRQEIKEIIGGFGLNQLDYSELCKQVDELEEKSPYS